MLRKTSTDGFVFVLAGIAVALAVAVAFVLQASPPKRSTPTAPRTIAAKATKAGLEKVTLGMHKSDVIALLGNKYDKKMSSLRHEVISWKTDSPSIVCIVEFENDRVVERTWLDFTVSPSAP